jgi:hypothetical protein
MCRKVDSPPTPAEKFELPFEGKLSQDNRWVIMANLIPWDEFEEEYAQNFAEDIGAPALPFRIALGSLIIKERLGISDRETVEKIKENPYIFYQAQLQKYLSQSKLITLKLLVWLVQSQKQVKIESLAATLPLPIQQNSRRRHIQRFLSLKRLSVVLLWFPLIQQIMARHIVKGKLLILALDRTQWKENNILMVSAIYLNRALPIFWILLEKKGASELREQQIVLQPVIKLFKAHKLVIIGDREFHSVELAHWLHRQPQQILFKRNHLLVRANDSDGALRFVKALYKIGERTAGNSGSLVRGWRRANRESLYAAPFSISLRSND